MKNCEIGGRMDVGGLLGQNLAVWRKYMVE